MNFCTCLHQPCAPVRQDALNDELKVFHITSESTVSIHACWIMINWEWAGDNLSSLVLDINSSVTFRTNWQFFFYYTNKNMKTSTILVSLSSQDKMWRWKNLQGKWQMAGKSEPETASDSPVRWTRMHHPPPISHPTTLKKDTVCVFVRACMLSLRQTPHHTHTHTLIHTHTAEFQKLSSLSYSILYVL